MNRRQWFQTSAMALGLAGCRSLDRWIFDGEGDPSSRVVILGGGLAGLSAAHHLHSRKVPFRIFEASPRWGGRVLTLQSFSSSQSPVDLGGEWIRNDQTQLLGLIRELRLETWKPKTSSIQIAGGGQETPLAKVNFAEFEKFLKMRAIQSTQEDMDGTSLEVFRKDLRKQVSDSTLAWFSGWCESEWGNAWKDMSSLQMAMHYQSLARPLSTSLSEESLRLKGGSRVLVQALLDRIVSVIPDLTTRKQHRLVSLEKKEGMYRLEFESPAGTQKVNARKVICTLPPPMLLEVQGLEALDLSLEQMQALHALRPGSLVKGVQLLQRESGSSALRTYSSAEGRWKWMHPSFERARNSSWLQTVQGTASTGLTLKPGQSQFVDWAALPGRGAKHYVKTGHWMQWMRNRNEFLSRKDWVFAGECFSNQPGTMAGAVESGILAAQKVSA